jgi:hypothetical protein
MDGWKRGLEIHKVEIAIMDYSTPGMLAAGDI